MYNPAFKDVFFVTTVPFLCELLDYQFFQDIFVNNHNTGIDYESYPDLEARIQRVKCESNDGDLSQCGHYNMRGYEDLKVNNKVQDVLCRKTLPAVSWPLENITATLRPNVIHNIKTQKSTRKGERVHLTETYFFVFVFL